MLGKQTFNLNKGEYVEKLSRVIGNHRANSKLVGEPRDFVLRSCRLTETWSKMASSADVVVYLRNIEIAGGRKVKMISLELGGTRQPVSKSKLVEALYPVRKIATSATPEEKHYNAVKTAMRGAVSEQLKEYRESRSLPCECFVTGKMIRKGMRTDVDHIGVSFSEIADCFVREKDLRYTDIALVGPPTAKRFKDASLWQEWQEYHKEKARYALVCSSANRAKGSSGYKTPPELYGSFEATSSEELSLDF